MKKSEGLSENREFRDRHIGIMDKDISSMLKIIGVKSLSELIENTIPQSILTDRKMNLPPALTEEEALKSLSDILSQNQVYKSYIGMGYHPTLTPSVIKRNVLENPGWYTQYTPYQAEIAQGRLEALLNFQTMICDLTAMPLANASLLDEATAAAEAMNMVFHLQGQAYKKTHVFRKKFLISKDCHPASIEVCATRAAPLGFQISLEDINHIEDFSDYFGLLLQYSDTYGGITDHTNLIEKAQAQGCKSIVIADLLSLTLLKPPGEMGVDVVVGNTQRFGVPMGFGGPHAAFFASREEYKRHIPGRIVGISKDKTGRTAYRLTLQTREQHIRRERATSNICTSQVLLAIMASMYACYHGPKGLKNIAQNILDMTKYLQKGLKRMDLSVSHRFFDTLKVKVANADEVLKRGYKEQINLRYINSEEVQISLDETTTQKDVEKLISLFQRFTECSSDVAHQDIQEKKIDQNIGIPKELVRTSDFLTHPVFNSYHSETEMLRYIFKLQSRDLSLAHSMIPLGSCTMKLNATTEMIPVTWPFVSNIHPFAPREQTSGYLKMILDLENWLAECVGLSATSIQPNAGSQGEYTGLLMIKKYHSSRGEEHRDICLIPQSAHGTNPASAIMAGLKVVVVKCDKDGNIDLEDLKEKVQTYQANIAAIMITYPSTHGVFELSIKEICEEVHRVGGQVYLDGANMNAQMGLCFPGDYGPDICHLNLHKTFAIPHGGGGPGVGPVIAKEHLKPFLPKHIYEKTSHQESQAQIPEDQSLSIGAISQAPYGSASVLPVSWMYIQMLGAKGLKATSEIAILNANYMAKRLQKYYNILYKGHKGYVAHECILDLRDWKKRAGIHVEDVAKRLIDYGFHAPTMSWPVMETLMLEPTESESKKEMDRFCEAMIAIYKEFLQIESGDFDREDNPLKQAPHTALEVTSDHWSHSYNREVAAFPLPYLKENKFWPAVGRVDSSYGDKNFFCTCPMPIS